MDSGPTPVENYRFLTGYLHSWAGETKPSQDAHRASCVELCVVGLIHWATQPNKESIYLVSEGMDLSQEEGREGSPEESWGIRLIRPVTGLQTCIPTSTSPSAGR